MNKQIKTLHLLLEWHEKSLVWNTLTYRIWEWFEKWNQHLLLWSNKIIFIESIVWYTVKLLEWREWLSVEDRHSIVKYMDELVKKDISVAWFTTKVLWWVYALFKEWTSVYVWYTNNLFSWIVKWVDYDSIKICPYRMEFAERKAKEWCDMYTPLNSNVFDDDCLADLV